MVELQGRKITQRPNKMARILRVVFVLILGKAQAADDLLISEHLEKIWLHSPTETTFPSSGVELSGLTVQKSSELKKQLSSYLGHSFALSQFEELNQLILAHYESTGRPVTLLDFPVSEQAHTLEVIVYEGQVNEALVEGADHLTEKTRRKLLTWMHGELITKDRLDEELTRINDHPFRKASLSVAPGGELGQADLLYRFTNPRPWHTSLGYQNSGPRGLDPHRFSIGLTGWLPNDATVQLGASFDSGEDRFQSYSLSYEHPLHGHWLQSWGASLGWATLEQQTNDTLLGGDSFRFESHATIFSQKVAGGQAKIQAGFDFLDLDSFLFFQETSIDADPLSIGHLFLRGTWQRKWDGLSLHAGASLFWNPGSELWGSNEDDLQSFDPNADSRYFYLTANAHFVKKLPAEWSLIGRLRGQWTPQRLLPSQRFSAGADQFLRAYEPRTFLADRGLNGSLELRTPSRNWQKLQWQIGGFFDWAYLDSEEALPNESDGDWFNSLGIQFITNWDKQWSFNLSHAWASGEDSSFTFFSTRYHF